MSEPFLEEQEIAPASSKSIFHRKQSMSVSTIILLVANLLKNASMFLINIVIAAVFGASYLTDAFFLAYLLTVRLGIVMTGCIHFTFVPSYSGFRATRSDEEVRALTNAFFNNILLLTLIGTIVFFVGAPIVIKLFCFDADSAAQLVTVHITRALSPTLFFFMAFALLQALLISHKIFLAPSVASLLVPAGLFAGLFLLPKSLGIYSLAIGLIIGSAVQCLVPVPVVRGLGHRYQPVLLWNTPEISGMRRDALGIAVIAVLGQIVIAADRIFASRLAEGSVSALTYAATLTRLAPFILYFSLLTSAFPTMSEMAAQGRFKEFQGLINQLFRLIGLVMVPVTATFMYLGLPIVQLLLQHGKFDREAAALTNTAIQYYAPGFLAFALQGPFVQAFFVLKKIRFSVIWSLATVLVTLCLNYALLAVFGFKGLPLAYSTAMYLHLAVCFVAIKVFVKGFHFEKAQREFCVMLASGAVMAAVLKLTSGWLHAPVTSKEMLDTLFRIAVPGACGLCAYVGSLLLLRSEDLRFLIAKVRSWGRPRTQISTAS